MLLTRYADVLLRRAWHWEGRRVSVWYIRNYHLSYIIQQGVLQLSDMQQDNYPCVAIHTSTVLKRCCFICALDGVPFCLWALPGICCEKFSLENWIFSHVNALPDIQIGVNANKLIPPIHQLPVKVDLYALSLFCLWIHVHIFPSPPQGRSISSSKSSKSAAADYAELWSSAMARIRAEILGHCLRKLSKLVSFTYSIR